MPATTPLLFGLSNIPMWGPNSPNIDQTYNLVDFHYDNQNVFGFGGNLFGIDASMAIGFSYGADFNIAAHLKWDFGSMAVQYDIDAGIPDDPELFLNEIVHFDTSGFSQLSSQLLTTGLDPANFNFDLTMTYGAYAQFDAGTGVTIGGIPFTLDNPYSVFNLPQVTNTLFEANLSDYLNGDLHFAYPGSLISGDLWVPLDPLNTTDTGGPLIGDLDTLVSNGSTIDILQASLDLDGLVAAFFGAPSPLGLNLPLFTDPGGGSLSFNFDLLDTAATLGFRIEQDFEFTPDPVAVTMHVAETGQVLTGVLGDDFVFNTPNAGYGEHNVHVSYHLTGELRNLTSLVISGELSIDVLKASITNTILAPLLGFNFEWGPLYTFARSWDLAKIALFDQTFDLDLGVFEVDYVVPWERFYVGTADADVIGLTPHQVSYDGLGGNDVTAGNDLDNIINGGAGDDRILGFEGADQLDGGEGDADVVSYYSDAAGVIVNLDSVSHTAGNVSVAAHTAIDGWGFVDQIANFEQAIGSRFDDFLFAGAAGSVLGGEAGDDFLQGNVGVDKLLGGGGIDFLYGDAGDDILQGGSEDDFLYGEGDNDILMGQDGADHIDGGVGLDLADYQVDAAGVVVNLSLEEVLVGGVVTASGTALDGHGDIDTLVAIEGAIGSVEVDHFFGNAQYNEFYGRAGNDIFYASDGADRLVGEQGDDTYYVESTTTDVWDNKRSTGGGYDTILSTVDYTLSDVAGHRADIEELRLAGDARQGTGNALDNVIIGTSGDDILDGAGGSDSLRGGRGNDVYYFDTGSDRVVENFDEGHDVIFMGTASFSNLHGVPTYSLSESWAVNVEDLLLTDSIRNVNLTGNALDNLLVGNGFGQTLIGLAGNDTLIGAGGGDELFGGTGNDRGVFDLVGPHAYSSSFDGGNDIDTLVMDWSLADRNITYYGTSYYTNFANDGSTYVSFSNVERFELTGGVGNDDLRGGALDDILIGGNGTDRLIGGTGRGTYTGGAGNDIVVATIRTGEDVDLGLDFVLRLADTQNGPVTVNAGTDVETIWSGVEFAQITTGSGNDTLDARGIPANTVEWGYSGHLFDSGAGNDTFAIDLNSRGYSSVFTAGSGIDTLVMDWSLAGRDITWGAAHYYTNFGNYGSIYLNYSGVERFQLTGGAGNDDLRGGVIDDTLIGGAGADHLVGGTGRGTYTGGAGNDIVVATIRTGEDVDLGLDFVLRLSDTQNGPVTVNAGTDVETIWNGVEFARITTGSGNDTLDVRGVPENIVPWSYEGDLFDSGEGNDTFAVDLNSHAYNHVFTAGLGVDTLVMDWSRADRDIRWGAASYYTNFGNYGSSYLNYSGVERFQLTGGAGNDDLRGGALDDILVGNAGDDRLVGGEGRGTFTGGTGIDVVVATIASDLGRDFVLRLANTQNGPVTVNAGTDIETVWSGVEYVQLTTGAGNDTLDARGLASSTIGWGYQGNLFDAGAGDDTFAVDLNSRGYSHTFTAGDGVDTLIMDWSLADREITYNSAYYYTNYGNTGSNYLSYTDVERFQLTGGAAGDDLRGGAFDDALIGNAGNDRLVGGEGRGTYNGGADTDVVVTTIASSVGRDFILRLAATQNGPVTVNAGTDIETVWSGVEYIRLTTGAGNDTLDARGLATSSVVWGYDGNLFAAGAGDDTFAVDLNSTGYNHTFTAGDGVDTLIMDWSLADRSITYASTYYYTNYGNTGSNYLSYTDVERFQLTGGSGNDDLRGGALDDTLIGGGGIDTLTGGLGNDIYGVDDAGDVVVEAADGGILDTVETSISLTLAAGLSIERLRTANPVGTATINLTGNELAQEITGNAGANMLVGGDGIDTLIGGLGNDTYVNDGVDTIIEGLNAGIDTVQSSVTIALGANLENLLLTGGLAINGTGNALNNVITGNALANTLNGLTGIDTLIGGLGNDTYVTDGGDTITEALNAGIDTVQSSVTIALGSNLENLLLTGGLAINGTGNALNNVITGNALANTLTGGLGADALTGGLGVDRFVFSTIGETGVLAATRDIITDFDDLNIGGDLIDLSLIDANGALAGSPLFSLLAQNAAFTGAGQLRWYTLGGNTIVEGNIDANLGADFSIQLTGIKTLVAADFVL